MSSSKPLKSLKSVISMQNCHKNYFPMNATYNHSVDLSVGEQGNQKLVAGSLPTLHIFKSF